MSSTWKQYRSVEAGEVSLDGLDLDIKVAKPKDDPLEFEISTWNLTSESWDRIETGDLCRVKLGWQDGEIATVVLGKIDTLDRTPEQGNVKFTLKGIDETEAATKTRPPGQTWKDKRPDQIVEDLASEVGLAAQTESTEKPIRGTWSVTRDKTLTGWLDDLLEIAAEQTGKEWEWFAMRGQIYFLPRNEDTEEAPQLSYDGILSSIGPKSNTDDDVEGQLKFEAMLEPRIAKGAAVFVATEKYRGPYRVSDYEFRSSTVSGDHLVKGTLVPIDADYSVA